MLPSSMNEPMVKDLFAVSGFKWLKKGTVPPGARECMEVTQRVGFPHEPLGLVKTSEMRRPIPKVAAGKGHRIFGMIISVNR